MTVLAILIPASLALGLLGLAGFLWMVRHDQFDDPEGHAMRLLSDRYDDEPASHSTRMPSNAEAHTPPAGPPGRPGGEPSARQSPIGLP